MHYTKFRLTKFILAFILLLLVPTHSSLAVVTPLGSCLGHNLVVPFLIFGLVTITRKADRMMKGRF